jgi:hypothetical protein
MLLARDLMEKSQQRIDPFTGEELQVKFLSDFAENLLKY